ncbi:MAG: type III secretion system chaperone, partial [Victivallales bacterium]|nr:type III secretion system chaperone [Victivallales bacterium]
EAEVSLLYCPDAGDMVLVTAKLMDLPSDDGNVLVAALEANHRLEATNGATISLDEEENSLVLSMYLPLDLLTAEALVSRLEAFMAAFFSMKEKLSAL